MRTAIRRWRHGLAFLVDQARKTINRPTRVLTIPYTLSRQRLAPIIPQGFRALRLAGSSPAGRDSTAPSEAQMKSLAGTEHPLGELQGNNCYLQRNPPREFSELAQRHKDRRLDNFLIDAGLLERQNLALARRLQSFFLSTDTYRHLALEDIIRCIVAYREIYLAAPVVYNQYGLNFTSGLCLFVMARCLGPPMIVESGVYKGLSSYILASACPAATINSFDPNLTELAFRTPGVTYLAHDWMNTEIRCGSIGKGLCFFDDHQSQALRIVQAHERGFRHLIFDDSWSVEAVIGCGWPPLPSIDMVMDDPLAPGQTVSWAEGSQIWSYVHTEEVHALCRRARELIRAAYDLPSLYRQSGTPPSSALKFVELM